MDKEFFHDQCEQIRQINQIDQDLYQSFEVKRGLRNADGSGVVAGVTNISNVHGYVISDGEKRADDGKLSFRGYSIYDLIGDDGPERRFNYEEIAYLLLMGALPTKDELSSFQKEIDENRELPDGFTASYIMKDTSTSIMNMLERTIQFLYTFDPYSDERSMEHEIKTAISLLSKLPRIIVITHYAKISRFEGDSMILHRFIPGQSTAETFLSMLRPDRSFTPEEARLLDILMCLHAEHGGGNNSTFTTRVLTSADTDPYSTYAAAIGSLKGYKHGGANHKVRAMHNEIKENVKDWTNEGEVGDYLAKILKKEAFDGTGLIYGMGHAVYTRSDPRVVIVKKHARDFAAQNGFGEEFALLELIERISPEIILKVKGTKKDMCANIDMYTGLMYTMLGIPEDLFTPLFAASRMAGWAAHRFEEIVSGHRIIRPAYKSGQPRRKTYIPMDER